MKNVVAIREPVLRSRIGLSISRKGIGDNLSNEGGMDVRTDRIGRKNLKCARSRSCGTSWEANESESYRRDATFGSRLDSTRVEARNCGRLPQPRLQFILPQSKGVISLVRERRCNRFGDWSSCVILSFLPPLSFLFLSLSRRIVEWLEESVIAGAKCDATWKPPWFPYAVDVSRNKTVMINERERERVESAFLTQ